MIVDPATRPAKDNYRLLISALIPRPIAFVSSVSATGVYNAAPFSFFMGVSSHPPSLAVSVGRRAGKPKDTAQNVLDTREFVVNLVTEDIAEKMNVASGDYAADVSEFEEAGLTPVPSEVVRAPRIEESPVNFECLLAHAVDAPGGTNVVLLGEVVRMHVRDDVLTDEGLVDVHKLHPIGRLGGPQYCRVRDVFEMPRPKVTGAKSALETRAY